MPLLSFSVSAFLATHFLNAASLPHPQPPNGVSLALSLEFPSSVDDVGDFTVTGTLKSEGTKDVTVVTDPSGILFDYFPPDVLDFTKVESDGKSQPEFVGGTAKWSIETYLINHDQKGMSDSDTKNNDSESESPDESSSESSEYSSDDGSKVSESDSSNSSEGSSQGEGKTYPRYTTQDLPAGKSMDFKYEVGKGYDFTESGAGAYNVKLSRDFFWVLVDDIVTKVKVDVKTSTVSIKGKLAGDIVLLTKKVENRQGDTTKRAFTLGTRGCSPIQTAIINRSAKIANQLVASSREALADMTVDGSDRSSYEEWFGDWDTKPDPSQLPYPPRDHVKAIFKGLRTFNLPGDQGGYTYNCDCDLNVAAWVGINVRKSDSSIEDPPDHPVINICKVFYSDMIPVGGGFDTKAGTLIHEATHFPFVIPRTKDFETSVEDVRPLSSEPFKAVINADSYEYFAEGYYKP